MRVFALSKHGTYKANRGIKLIVFGVLFSTRSKPLGSSTYSRQDPSDDTIREDITIPGLATASLQGDLNVVSKRVLDNNSPRTIGVQRGDRLDSRVALVAVTPSSAEDRGTLWDKLRELSQHVVIDRILVRPSRLIHHEETSARPTAPGDVRPVRIARPRPRPQRPHARRFHPVLQRTNRVARGLVPRCRMRRPALRHVVLLVRVRLLEGADDAPVHVRLIAMPRRRLDVPARRVYHGLRVRRLVRVVVVRPDLHVVEPPGGAKRRSHELLRHPPCFLRRLRHRHVAAPLVVQRLVLDRDGVYGDPQVRVRLQVLHEIVRVVAVVLRVEPVAVGIPGELLKRDCQQVCCFLEKIYLGMQGIGSLRYVPC